MDLYDHFIKELRRFGIICYQRLNEGAPQFLFAWQIYQDKHLLACFDSIDRSYIEPIAQMELKDGWYTRAGGHLKTMGYQDFLQMMDAVPEHF